MPSPTPFGPGLPLGMQFDLIKPGLMKPAFGVESMVAIGIAGPDRAALALDPSVQRAFGQIVVEMLPDARDPQPTSGRDPLAVVMVPLTIGGSVYWALAAFTDDRIAVLWAIAVTIVVALMMLPPSDGEPR